MTLKAVTAGGALALLVGAGWLVTAGHHRPLLQPVTLHAPVAASNDESPFGIAAHRRPPRAAQQPRVASAARAAPIGAAATIERLTATRDPRDAYRAFRLIARCVQARRLDDEMKALPMGPEHAAERLAYGDGRRRVQAACLDITAAQIAMRLSLVEQAARAGVPGAVTAWVEEGPFGDPSALDQRPDDPLVAAWVEQAIEAVKDAARRDDVEAIIQLGLLSLNWERDEAARVKLLLHPGGVRTVADSIESADAARPVTLPASRRGS
jgi:hypothetical protein